MKKVDLIVDMQFGSTGKGLIAGYLADKATTKYDIVVNANMPNAGHTYINADGLKMMHKVLPNGIIGKHVQIAMIGPGSVFSIEQLDKEIANLYELGFQVPQIMIHPCATVLRPDHAVMEKATLSGISSTMQGSAVAMIDKIMRPMDNPVIARDVMKGDPRVCTHGEWTDALRWGKHILAEGAQGFSLGVNQEFYPFCTSRDCGPARFMSDMGLPLRMLNKIIGTARTYPIRVGNTADGYSGDWYPDQEEVEWSSLGLEPELTTVTQRPRRIASFSWMQMKDAMFYIRPDEIFLNFANYCKPDRVQMIVDQVGNICRSMGGNMKGIKYIGHGASYNDVEEI